MLDGVEKQTEKHRQVRMALLGRGVKEIELPSLFPEYAVTTGSDYSDDPETAYDFRGAAYSPPEGPDAHDEYMRMLAAMENNTSTVTGAEVDEEREWL